MLIKETEAAILIETGKPLKIETIRLPKSLTEGQVLVELITSGICGAQLNEIDAVKGPDKFLPHLLGHEGYANVLETGPGVTKVKAGDKVIMHWRPSQGKQSETPKYYLGNAIINAGWVTTFNKHSIVSENRLTKVVTDLDQLFLPLLGCALTTALGVLKNDVNIRKSESLLITGFGGVGLSILQFAKVFGVENITVVDINPDKEKSALELGADKFVIFRNKEQCKKELSEHFDFVGAPSVAIETTGNVHAIELCYELTSEIGRVALVGVPKIGNKVSIYTLPLHFGKILTGSKGGQSNPDVDIPEIINLFQSKKLYISNFPIHSIDFENINKGITMIREGINGRVIIKF